VRKRQNLYKEFTDGQRVLMEISILKYHNLQIPVKRHTKSQLDLKYDPLSALFQLQYNMKTLQYKSARSVNICALSMVQQQNYLQWCQELNTQKRKNQDNLEGVHYFTFRGKPLVIYKQMIKMVCDQRKKTRNKCKEFTK